MSAPGERTLEDWKAGLLDEILFTAAATLSEAGVDPERNEVTVSLDVSVEVDGGSLVLVLHSAVDGRLRTTITSPF